MMTQESDQNVKETTFTVYCRKKERQEERKNSADKSQAGVIGVRRGASPLSSHNLTLTITPATLHSSPSPLHPPLP